MNSDAADGSELKKHGGSKTGWVGKILEPGVNNSDDSDDDDSDDDDEEEEIVEYPEPTPLRISTLTGTCSISSDINLLVLVVQLMYQLSPLVLLLALRI